MVESSLEIVVLSCKIAHGHGFNIHWKTESTSNKIKTKALSGFFGKVVWTACVQNQKVFVPIDVSVWFLNNLIDHSIHAQGVNYFVWTNEFLT